MQCVDAAWGRRSGSASQKYIAAMPPSCSKHALYRQLRQLRRRSPAHRTTLTRADETD